MFIEYKGKEIKLRFDVLFLKEIDKKLGFETEGVNIGKGMTMIAGSLEGGDIPTLMTIIEVAQKYSKKKFKKISEIEDYLDDLIENEADDEDAIQALCDEVLEEMGKRPTIRRAMYGKEKKKDKKKEA
ncbi:tail assembly chaperone [Staphylococcus sp. IVB6238]|uniref:tail assembly chaperone n=1 Tax=Staphylococcus sp. IVB6238 TaxID=2989770 RepID=UPI0021CDF33C|nr:tail assembly chaperone [Staphylococcus sp. IVB6238]UXR73297.1 tail assembly chaperone [Staphylococcus sp. IVB6238]